jgi:hypothetical protein
LSPGPPWLRVLSLFPIVISLATSSSIPVQVNAAPIPSDWVITPFGYEPSQCVYGIGNNARVFRNDTVVMGDGKRLTPPPCPYAHQNKVDAPTTNGWVEDAAWTSSSPVQNFSGYWTVPGAPGSNDNQVIYLFIGLEQSQGVEPIIQPVLQWGYNLRFGGPYWEIASWIYLDNNNLLVTNRYDVGNADTIHGLLEGTNNPNCAFPVTASCRCTSGSCYWWIYTHDVSQPEWNESLTESYFLYTSPLTMMWAAMALEVYNVMFCADYPSAGVTLFQYLSLNDKSGNVLTPAWQAQVFANDLCSEKVVVSSAGYVTFYWYQSASGTSGGGGGCSALKQRTITNTPKPC